MTLTLLLFPLFAYLLGSISSAILICRLYRLPDPRSSGSQNPGATNVMRLGGKKPAAMTLVGDLLKGLIPVLIARLLKMDDLTIALTALAAFLGHLFPLYFQFKGGKGVATAFGVIIALSPLLAVAVFTTWIGVFLLTRVSSLSALTATTLAPLYLLIPPLSLPKYSAIALLIMIGLLLYRHRSNIQRLIRGEESAFRAKK